LKPIPISVNHLYAATSDILILLVALFIQIVALYILPKYHLGAGNCSTRLEQRVS
jgi:hypothetical protein